VKWRYRSDSRDLHRISTNSFAIRTEYLENTKTATCSVSVKCLLSAISFFSADIQRGYTMSPKENATICSSAAVWWIELWAITSQQQCAVTVCYCPHTLGKRVACPYRRRRNPQARYEIYAEQKWKGCIYPWRKSISPWLRFLNVPHKNSPRVIYFVRKCM
jgi:hypothetical protein